MIVNRARSCQTGFATPSHAPPPMSLRCRDPCGTGRRESASNTVALPPCQSGRQLMSPQSSVQIGNLTASQQVASGASTSAVPHIIRGNGRTAEQLADEIRRLLPFQHTVLVARVDATVAEQLKGIFPDAQHHPRGQMLSVRSELSNTKAEKQPGTVGIICGSPAHEGVAEECRIAAAHIGCYAFQLNLSNLEALRSADVVIVVSDLDGALPAALAGAVESPVIAVPTSDAQAGVNSLTPLLAASLSSSSPVGFVHIDDGLSAASMAMRILRKVRKFGAGRASASAPVHSADRSNNSVSPSTQEVVLGPRCAWPAQKVVMQ